MTGFTEALGDDDSVREQRSLDAERPLALTPLLELVRGDGYRWASLDVVDLDPPAVLPPSGRNE